MGASHPPRDWQGGCIEARCGEEARLAPKVDGKEDAAGIDEGAEEQQSSDCCQHDPVHIAWQAVKQAIAECIRDLVSKGRSGIKCMKQFEHAGFATGQD